jgi:hypothetical protein
LREFPGYGGENSKASDSELAIGSNFSKADTQNWSNKGCFVPTEAIQMSIEPCSLKLLKASVGDKCSHYKILRYNIPMTRYRKLLVVSLIGLTAIVMVLYSYPLVDWYPKQNQTVSIVSISERGDENQSSSRNIPLSNGNQEVQPTVEGQVITEKLQDITTPIENITLSGWVGTEFREYIAGETVVLYSPSQQTYYSIDTGFSGEFSFIDIKPGWDYVLKVSPQGMFKRYTKSYIKLKSEQEVHNIILESIPRGILIGRIVDPYEGPVSDIELSLTTVEKDSWTTNVITDANGTFSVNEFPIGRFKVAIKGQQSLWADGLQFDPDTGVPVILTIDLGSYNLVGRIYDESGQTFDGADVFLNWALHENGVSIRSTRKVSANTSGEFRFTGLGPGNHELVVTAWGGDTFKQTVKLTVNVGVDSGELIIVLNTL